MKTLIYLAVIFLAAVGYRLAVSPEWQEAVGASATAIIKPLVLPLVELINVPAFVYVVAVLILFAGILACVAYWFRAVRPRLRQLEAVRAAIHDLPLPFGVNGKNGWSAAMHELGVRLRSQSVFVSAWSDFQGSAARARGIPNVPFSHFVASEPQQAREKSGFMASLPGYFTSIGLIFTFVGLVVALYFAAKGFRSSNIQDARAAIIQLLNAASFKFLTSVAALISALIVSLCLRYGLSLISRETLAVAEQIESYLSAWREQVGTGDAGEQSATAELVRRMDALLEGMQDLTRAVDGLVRQSQERLLEQHDAAR